MGDGQGQSGQGGKGGGFGNFMMNIGAPAAATIAAGMGPRYAASAAIGMSAVNNLQENKRRQKLGREVARLADVRADAALEAEKKAWNKKKEIMTAVMPEELSFDDNTAMEYFGQANPQGENALKAKKTSEFIEKAPEPVRDEAFELFGAIAEGGDPEGAIAMMRDDDQFRQQLAMKSMDYIERQAAAEAERKVDKANRRADSAINRSTRLAEANYRSERDATEDEFAQAGLDLKRAQGDRAYALDKQRLDQFLPGKELEFQGRQLNDLRDAITTLETGLRSEMATEEEIAAATAPYRAEYNSILAERHGAQSYYDADGNLVSIGGGGAPTPPAGVGDTDSGTPVGAVLPPEPTPPTPAQPTPAPSPEPAAPSPSAPMDHTAAIEELRAVRLKDEAISNDLEQMKSANISAEAILDMLEEKYGPGAFEDYTRRNTEGLGIRLKERLGGFIDSFGRAAFPERAAELDAAKRN